MAFTLVPVVRIVPSMGRRGTSPRRRRSGGGMTRRRSARMDPILDDNDVDQTDCNHYYSCGKCSASIMLSPEAFRGVETLQVQCHVCELRSNVSLEMLETVSGEPFNAAEWRMAEAIRIRMARSASEN